MHAVGRSVSQSVPDRFFHVISLACQQPFTQSLMHLTASTFHFCCDHKDSFRPWISYTRFLFSKLPTAARPGTTVPGNIHLTIPIFSGVLPPFGILNLSSLINVLFCGLPHLNIKGRCIRVIYIYGYII